MADIRYEIKEELGTMFNKPKYSVIKYYEELLEEDIEKIYSYLKDGIVIHLFLNGNLKEELRLNEYSYDDFEIAIKFNFLYLYENCGDIFNESDVIAIDGYIINKNYYKRICENSDLGFNNEQYDIVTAPVNSNIIVVSGAGTGKTTTMINRLIYLRKTEMDFRFEEAILITFTNKASREMREKLITLLEKYYKVTKNPIYLDMMDEVARCNISTIHGFSKKLINQYGKNININKNILVKSFKYKRSNAITEALNRVYREDKELYNIVRYYPIYELESRIMEIWNKLDNYSIDTSSKEYIVDFGNDDKGFSKLLSKVIKYAQEIINEDKEYELEVSDLMKKLSNKELFKAAKGKYKLMMLDEFQDSDNIQIEFAASFCRETGCNLLVVGDEKQSIYRFRGAEYTSFDKLKEFIGSSNKPTIEFTMVRNYRTDSKLLEEINRIFIDVNNRVDCFAYNEKDHIYSLLNKEITDGIKIVNLKDYEDKISFYSNLRDSKSEDETMAVLLRSNNDIKEFKEFCDRHQIPCRVDETGGFYRHEAVRDFYVMVKALIEDNDTGTLYAYAQSPYINMNIDKNNILEFNHEGKRDYIKSLLEEKQWTNYKTKVKEVNPLVLFDKVISDLKPVRNYYETTLLEAKKTQKKYKEVAYIKTLEYKLNLEHLLYLLKENFTENITSIYQIENFLRIKIASDNTIDPRKLVEKYEKGFIQCLTVHKAKGLEYDHVIMDKLTKQFITGFKTVDVILRTSSSNKIEVGYKVLLGRDNEEYKNNIYSSYLFDEKNEILGEESRLLYVALTRCKQKLYLNMDGTNAATASTNTWKSLVGGVLEYV